MTAFDPQPAEQGWRTAWLDRTYDPLQSYTLLVVVGLTLVTLFVFTKASINIRRARRECAEAADSAAYDRAVQKLFKPGREELRKQFVINYVYLLNALVITLADAVICFQLLEDEVASEPDAWTREFVTEFALYGVYAFVALMACFILVPMLQMLLVTYFLSRFSKKHGSHALSAYIPEARLCSTHFAQFWCMTAFFVAAYWAPTADDISLWRYLLLQAAVGSAFAWLQASFAFNYRVEQIESQEIAAGDDGVRGVLLMFGRAARVVHSYGSIKPDSAVQGYVRVVDEKV